MKTLKLAPWGEVLTPDGIEPRHKVTDARHDQFNFHFMFPMDDRFTVQRIIWQPRHSYYEGYSTW